MNPFFSLFLFHWEQTEESIINHIGDFLEVLRVALEVCCVTIYYHQVPFIGLYPVLITLVQTAKVVYAHCLFVLSASLLYVINEVRDGTSEVNEQVWELHQRHHEFEKVGVIIEITLRHEPHVMQIRGKDTCIFKDSTVLYDCIL